MQEQGLWRIGGTNYNTVLLKLEKAILSIRNYWPAAGKASLRKYQWAEGGGCHCGKALGRKYLKKTEKLPVRSKLSMKVLYKMLCENSLGMCCVGTDIQTRMEPSKLLTPNSNISSTLIGRKRVSEKRESLFSEISGRQHRTIGALPYPVLLLSVFLLLGNYSSLWFEYQLWNHFRVRTQPLNNMSVLHEKLCNHGISVEKNNKSTGIACLGYLHSRTNREESLSDLVSGFTHGLTYCAWYVTMTKPCLYLRVLTIPAKTFKG